MSPLLWAVTSQVTYLLKSPRGAQPTFKLSSAESAVLRDTGLGPSTSTSFLGGYQNLMS